MTWTGDPVWLADVLRAEGIKVVEYPGWKDRGHGDMGTIWGVVAHHTGNNPPGNNPGYIANHPSLGLCSQIHLSRDGVATVVGVGVAWHAGSGSYPGLPTNGANERTIGIEAENNGTEGWSPAQYDAYVRCCAAILRKVGQPASHAIGHKEWAGAAQGKWDPGGMDMNKFRADIQARIDGAPAAPATPGGFLMALNDDQQKTILTAAERINGVVRSRTLPEGQVDPESYPHGGAAVLDAADGAYIVGKIDGLKESIDALTAAIKAGK